MHSSVALSEVKAVGLLVKGEGRNLLNSTKLEAESFRTASQGRYRSIMGQRSHVFAKQEAVMCVDQSRYDLELSSDLRGGLTWSGLD